MIQRHLDATGNRRPLLAALGVAGDYIQAQRGYIYKID